MGIRDGQLIETAQLRQGDILLLYDNSFTGHFMVALGQGVSKAFRAGSRKLVHVVMWARPQDRPLQHGHQIVEASGAHGVRTHWLRQGLYVAYQLTAASRTGGDPSLDLGVQAAQVALEWAGREQKIPYSKWRALNSVIHNTSYGENAQARAAKWATGEKEPFEMGAFCSEFVMAAYQAAGRRLNRPPHGITAADAKHSTVRDLHEALMKDGRFEWTGNVQVDSSPGDGK